ncbi:MAG: hypothetical protein CVU90_08950 [Firmicutes bacterium HGW-Firmicutes-15]|nr:MAG: hypothetical protein CVU90_08950 [Firmicutes bacterium HGW-Firmicutes-15]
MERADLHIMRINLGGNAVSESFSSLGMKGFFVLCGKENCFPYFNEWVPLGINQGGTTEAHSFRPFVDGSYGLFSIFQY